jgi:hypothetical protein
LAVLRASGPIFRFCTPGPISGGIESAEYNFHVSHSRNHFRRYRGRRVPFSYFALPDSFSFFALLDSFLIVRGRRVRKCFALPNPFWAVPRAPSPIFKFCVPELVLGGTKGVGSSFLVLRSQTHFRRYRRRHVSFSYFVLPDSYSAVRGRQVSF